MLREDASCVFLGHEESLQRCLRLSGKKLLSDRFKEIANLNIRYDIMVENRKIATSMDFVRAMSCMMTRNYVFNLSYEKNSLLHLSVPSEILPVSYR